MGEEKNTPQIPTYTVLYVRSKEHVSRAIINGFPNDAGIFFPWPFIPQSLHNEGNIIINCFGALLYETKLSAWACLPENLMNQK